MGKNHKKTNSAVKPTPKRGRAKRILGYTGLVLAVIIGAGGGYGLYEYHHLLPKNYLKTGIRPVIGNGTGQYSKQADGTFNMLLMGTDANQGQVIGHSDSMMLVHVDLNKHQINMVSIPRDTRVYFPGYGYTKLTSVQYMDQANHGVQKGTDEAVQVISQLTGVPINYYAETNYTGLQSMIEAVGGITMDLPFPITINHAWYTQDNGMHFDTGPHFVDGNVAFELTHTRDGLPGTDYGRQRMQEAALVGIAKQVMRPSELTKLPQLSQSLKSYLTATNMPQQLMVSIGLGMKGHFSASNIHYDQLVGPSETEYNDVLQANDSEVILPQSEIQAMIKKDFS